MTLEKTKNLAASVRQKLLNIIRETGADANLIWTRYATERLLYRLSVSEYAGDFVLKGAMLFVAWTGQSYRPTADMDLLGHGEDSRERMTEIFRTVCGVEAVPDGLVFDPGSVKVNMIREDLEYQGQRVTLTASLGKARIPIQVDVGFGDAVTPRARKISYPTLLGDPAPRILACPRETVVAEKLHTLVVLGIANSRMKDFHDLYILARDFAFDGSSLTKAIQATFRRRKTKFSQNIPLALTEEFGLDTAKSAQWRAFLLKSGLQQSMPGLSEVIEYLQTFLLPVVKAVSGQMTVPRDWNPGGPWLP